VVLNIGGDVGALVLRVPASYLGRELDVASVAHGAGLTHSEVRERLVDGEQHYCATYPSLKEGYYVLKDSGQGFEIVGGRVTHMTLLSSGDDLSTPSTFFSNDLNHASASPPTRKPE